MRIRRLLATALAGVAVTALTAACGSSGSSTPATSASCVPAHKFTTITKGVLTVASYDLPPYTDFTSSGFKGVDAAILDAIAKEECLTVKATQLATAAVIPSVQAGRSDVAAGDWYRTQPRSLIVGLTVPIYTDQMGIVSKTGISSIPALKDQTVGTVAGYLWDNDLQKYLGGKLKIYQTPQDMDQDLKSGRITVGVDSYGSALYSDKGFKVEVAQPLAAIAASVQPAQSTFPTVKSNTALLAALNADITALKSSGELAKILVANGLSASAANTGAPRLIGA